MATQSRKKVSAKSGSKVSAKVSKSQIPRAAAGRTTSAQVAQRPRSQAASASIVDLAPKKSIFAAAGVAAVAGAAYFFRHELMGLAGYKRMQMSDDVRAKLPMAKNLQTIPDFDGNYDIDGVSFDTEGVVVGSDRQSQTHPQV